MKKPVLFLIVIVLASFIATPAFESGDVEVWKHVADNSYIDPDLIFGTEGIYGFSFILKSYNKGQYEPVYGKKIWYTVAQYTIDCSKMLYKIGVIDSYGYENNFINGDYNRFAKFQPIVQGTAVSVVAKNLCKY